MRCIINLLSSEGRALNARSSSNLSVCARNFDSTQVIKHAWRALEYELVTSQPNTAIALCLTQSSEIEGLPINFFHFATLNHFFFCTLLQNG